MCSRRTLSWRVDPVWPLTPAQKRALARKLRRTATPMERHAWTLLRNRAMHGLKFRRQHVLRGFIVDFYCAAQRLVIELEGDMLEPGYSRAYHATRAAVLEAAGYRMVRVPPGEVTKRALEELIASLLATFAMSRG